MEVESRLSEVKACLEAEFVLFADAAAGSGELRSVLPEVIELTRCVERRVDDVALAQAMGVAVARTAASLEQRCVPEGA